MINYLPSVVLWVDNDGAISVDEMVVAFDRGAVQVSFEAIGGVWTPRGVILDCELFGDNVLNVRHKELQLSRNESIPSGWRWIGGHWFVQMLNVMNWYYSWGIRMLPFG